MMLTTKGRYAVMAMVDIARQASSCPAKLSDIAVRQNVPLHYLEQISGKLRQADLLRAIKGPGGGYMLGKSADRISIYDILRAIEESWKMTRCAHGQTGCLSSNTRCLTHDLWEGLESHMAYYFKNITLAHVVERQLPAPHMHMPTGNCSSMLLAGGGQ